MKALLFTFLSVGLLFATTPAQREANLKNVVDIEIKHTDRIEKRITKIEIELERKAKEREEKAKIREERLKKRDNELKTKADARKDSTNDTNN